LNLILRRSTLYIPIWSGNRSRASQGVVCAYNVLWCFSLFAKSLYLPRATLARNILSRQNIMWYHRIYKFWCLRWPQFVDVSSTFCGCCEPLKLGGLSFCDWWHIWSHWMAASFTLIERSRGLAWAGDNVKWICNTMKSGLEIGKLASGWYQSGMAL